MAIGALQRDQVCDLLTVAGLGAAAVFVAAALQVAWTRMAALLDVADLGSGEADSGISQLWPHRQDMQLPTAVRALLEQVAHINHGDDLAWYPGSPQLAAQMLREGDHLRLFELHPTELGLLGRHFGDVKRGVTIHAEDGFAGLKSCLPPPPRRGRSRLRRLSVHVLPPWSLPWSTASRKSGPPSRPVSRNCAKRVG